MQLKGLTIYFFQSYRATKILDDPTLIPDEWFTDKDGNLFFLYKSLDTIIVQETDRTVYDLHFENEADTMGNWYVLHDQEVTDDFV